MKPSVTFFVLIFSLSVLLPAQAQLCQQVVSAGEPGWGPYSEQTKAGMRGLGHDIVAKIFEELDIPVKTVSRRQTEEAERWFGHFRNVDLVAATIERSLFGHTLSYVEPFYATDRTAVVFHRPHLNSHVAWQQLVGLKGLHYQDYPLEQRLQKIADELLHPEPVADYGMLFAKLLNGDARYALSSRTISRYAMQENGVERVFSVHSGAEEADPIQIAFVAESECEVYRPYIKMRIQQWLDDGTILKWHRKYMEPLDPLPGQQHHVVEGLG